MDHVHTQQVIRVRCQRPEAVRWLTEMGGKANGCSWAIITRNRLRSRRGAAGGPGRTAASERAGPVPSHWLLLDGRAKRARSHRRRDPAAEGWLRDRHPIPAGRAVPGRRREDPDHQNGGTPARLPSGLDRGRVAPAALAPGGQRRQPAGRRLDRRTAGATRAVEPDCRDAAAAMPDLAVGRLGRRPGRAFRRASE